MKLRLRKIFSLSVLAVVVLLIPGLDAHSQQVHPDREKLLRALRQRRLLKRDLKVVVKQIQQQGVSYDLSAADEKEIRSVGAYLGKKGLDDLIEAVRGNYRPGTLKLEQPTFNPSIEKVVFALGGNSYVIPTDALRKGPVNLLGLGGQNAIVARIEGGKLYTDVTIYGYQNMRAVELKRNEFLVRPPNWDYNRRDSGEAFEVVNERGIPVLQLYYKTPSHIVVNGIFPFPNPKDGVIYLSESGTIRDDSESYKVKPIFKYPSWKYRGQYADEIPAHRTGADKPDFPVQKIRAIPEPIPSSSEQYPFGLKITIQTNIPISPAEFEIECSGIIGPAWVSAGGRAGTWQGTRSGDPITGSAQSTVFSFRQDFPPLTPDAPIIVTLSSKERLSCRVKHINY